MYLKFISCVKINYLVATELATEFSLNAFYITKLATEPIYF